LVSPTQYPIITSMNRTKVTCLSVLCLALLLTLAGPLSAQSLTGPKRFFRTKPAPVVDSGFGAAVATNGPLVITGDPSFSALIGTTTFGQRGIVHVFNATTGAHIRSIEPPPADRSISDLQFGKAIALFGDILAVSSITRQASTVSDTRGVYLFRASTGTLLSRIPGPAIGFGASLALHGDILVTGSPEENEERGAIYLHSISTGTQLARLTAVDRAEGDNFGSAVAISPHYILVGAPQDNTTRGTNAGSGYLFENLPSFKQVRKLTDEGLFPDHPTNANAQLGSSVAIRNQQLFLGAPFGDVTGDPDCGFVFEFIANRPTDLRQILPVFPQEIRGFGTSLSTSDDLLAIGPASDPNGAPSTLILSLHNWEAPQFAASLIPIGIQSADQLGTATAIHGSTVYALTGNSPTPSQRGALFQLGPISRPAMPGVALFKTGTSAPGVPGASISGDLAQLHDPSTSASHHFLTLSGPGAAAVKGRGIWNQEAPTGPSVFPGQTLNPSGSISSLTSFRVGGGILFAQGKVAGTGINTSNDDVILAKIPNQPPFTAFSEGGFLPGFDSFTFVAIQSFKAYAANHSGEASLIGKLRTGAGLFASTTATADSFLATNNVQSPLPNASRSLREGDSVSSLTLGQFLPRVASGGSAHAFVTALSAPSDENQVALLFDATGPVIIAQKSELARFNGVDVRFHSFLGESIASGGSVIIRSTLSGEGVNRTNNEALHLAGRSISPNPIVRKGDIAPGFAPESNIRIAAFLSFQRTTQGGNVLFLARLTGPGVTSANDLALFVDVTESIVAIPPGNPVRPSHLLLREGDPLPTSSKAIIQTIHRVAYCDDGDYMALVSLVTRPGEATSADNLALLYGESRFTQPFPTDAESFRKPFLLLRKGAHLTEYGGRPVKSLSFFPGTLSPGGASGIGIGNVAGNGVPEWTLDLGSSLRASHHGGFAN
jgi:hypothetical protein